jgi:hypothetical protein
MLSGLRLVQRPRIGYTALRLLRWGISRSHSPEARILMAEDKPAEPKGTNEEIPRFRFAEKKVDSSWKEEIRKEREAAKEAPPPAPSAPSAPSPAPAHAPTAAPSAKGAAPGKPAAAAAPGAAGATGVQPSKLFLTFLAQLVQQCLMQLGQVENPFTNQRELDLEGARFTIELLAILQEKTKGNLAEQEARMLGEAVRELQLQYVEISQAVSREMNQQVKERLQNPPGKGGRHG